MKRKPTISEVMETLNPATTLKELLDLFNKLIKCPDYYGTSVGKNPRTTPSFKDHLTIGINYEADIKVSPKLLKELRGSKALDYKGKFYSVHEWHEERENYSGIDIKIFKPIKVK